jgi:hypothetical protein
MQTPAVLAAALASGSICHHLHEIQRPHDVVDFSLIQHHELQWLSGGRPCFFAGDAKAVPRPISSAQRLRMLCLAILVTELRNAVCVELPSERVTGDSVVNTRRGQPLNGRFYTNRGPICTGRRPNMQCFETTQSTCTFQSGSRKFRRQALQQIEQFSDQRLVTLFCDNCEMRNASFTTCSRPAKCYCVTCGAELRCQVES